jgi:hypothetical protein
MISSAGRGLGFHIFHGSMPTSADVHDFFWGVVLHDSLRNFGPRL